MTVRGALNLTAILLVVCNLLFVFSVWVGKEWVEKVQAIEPRVIRLETSVSQNMEDINRRLGRIEDALYRGPK